MFEPLTPQRHRRQALIVLMGSALLPMHRARAQAPAKARPAEPAKGDAMTLTFRGSTFEHRWSKDGQHEFTPPKDTDLAAWRDMITLNLHDTVTQGEQLAGLANKVLGNYQRHGKIVQTRSTPRTAQQPAEHLIVAVLGTPQLLEAVFARCMLRDGVGLVAVVSHRVYGKAVGPEMSQWLAANGPQVEQALMTWDALPAAASLKRLTRGA